MHKQRTALIIFSLLGMLATFFKWFSGFRPIPEDVLEASTGLEIYPNIGYVLGTNMQHSGGWVTFGIFALLLLFSVFVGKRKEPLNSIWPLVLNVAVVVFVFGKWFMEIDPTFYTRLDDQFKFASSIAEANGMEGLSELNLVPPRPDLGIFMAIGAAFFSIVFTFIFRKKSTKK